MWGVVGRIMGISFVFLVFLVWSDRLCFDFTSKKPFFNVEDGFGSSPCWSCVVHKGLDDTIETSDVLSFVCRPLCSNALFGCMFLSSISCFWDDVGQHESICTIHEILRNMWTMFCETQCHNLHYVCSCKRFKEFAKEKHKLTWCKPFEWLLKCNFSITWDKSSKGGASCSATIFTNKPSSKHQLNSIQFVYLANITWTLSYT